MPGMPLAAAALTVSTPGSHWPGEPLGPSLGRGCFLARVAWWYPTPGPTARVSWGVTLRSCQHGGELVGGEGGGRGCSMPPTFPPLRYCPPLHPLRQQHQQQQHQQQHFQQQHQLLCPPPLLPQRLRLQRCGQGCVWMQGASQGVRPHQSLAPWQTPWRSSRFWRGRKGRGWRCSHTPLHQPLLLLLVIPPPPQQRQRQRQCAPPWASCCRTPLASSSTLLR